MKVEVDKLSSIGFIKEVDYPTWLANLMMVRKPKKGWRMCVDYINLNRACPKDSFPLPRIDQLVDATAGHALFSFIDAYSEYNQIFTHPDDQAHTSFITDRGLYCYKVMPFELKNVGATYQHFVNSLFAPLIGNTMEVYVDDMLRGIEANPEKIQAILDIKIPKTAKDIQSLTGRVATLTRFISKATDCCTPFFKALEGNKRSITWTAECDKAFSELKEYMSRAPLLSTPKPGDTLTIYLSVLTTTVPSVLFRPHEGDEHPVHYVSKALQYVEVQ
ncbi:hypothetical protein L3X38_022209 [Prunus dulcis]|uniref:Reverse transcriptase domain-containing protein n=1 Tax=Prunus dulcis TaxID=3755 RepID=A0AAD4VWH7_PRUDU|nr:hypothetical protein L3X38_022209 [Prunus dulcis]